MPEQDYEEKSPQAGAHRVQRSRKVSGVVGVETVKGMGEESSGMRWGWSKQGHRHELGWA